MVSPLFYYQLALLAIIWLFVMLHFTWTRQSVLWSSENGHKIKLPERFFHTRWD